MKRRRVFVLALCHDGWVTQPDPRWTQLPIVDVQDTNDTFDAGYLKMRLTRFGCDEYVGQPGEWRLEPFSLQTDRHLILFLYRIFTVQL